MMPTDKGYTLGYVILRFPKKSENFITREVMAVRRLAGRVMVFSLNTGEYQPPQDPFLKIIDMESLRISFILKSFFNHFKDGPVGFPIILYRSCFQPVIKDLKQKKPLQRIVKNAKNRWKLFLNAVSISQFAKKNGIALLHAHYAHQPSEIASTASRLSGIPFSFTAHAKDLYTAKKSRLEKLVKNAAFVSTCTRDGHTHLTTMVSPKYHEKIHCVHHGIDLQQFENNPKTVGSRRGLLILSAGRFTEKKGFDTLIDALDILRRRNLKFKCVIAGDGKLYRTVQRLVKARNLDESMEMPGFLSERDLMKLYRQADVFVLPSKILSNGNRDGIPNVILEAMAWGVPVVATTVGGIPEVVKHNVNGLLTSPENTVLLADTLECLLKDDRMRKKFGENAREYVFTHFDIYRNTSLLYDLFCKFSDMRFEKLSNQKPDSVN
jgi:glycosyltransferase involved in cell wall biosynthesis